VLIRQGYAFERLGGTGHDGAARSIFGPEARTVHFDSLVETWALERDLHRGRRPPCWSVRVSVDQHVRAAPAQHEVGLVSQAGKPWFALPFGFAQGGRLLLGALQLAPWPDVETRTQHTDPHLCAGAIAQEAALDGEGGVVEQLPDEGHGARAFS